MIKVAGIYIIERYEDFISLLDKLGLRKDHTYPDRTPCVMLISEDHEKAWDSAYFYSVAFVYDIDTTCFYKKDKYDDSPISFT